MAIAYVAYNQQGEKVTGVLEVDSPSRAEEILLNSGHIVVTLKKKTKLPSLAQLMPTFFGAKPLEVINFTRELASLLESGIPLVPCLRILQLQVAGGIFKEALRAVIQDIEAGLSFSQACARQAHVFPPFYARLLQVSEEAGELRRVLEEITAYMERQRVTAGKVKKALTYPSIVLLMGIAAALIFVVFSLPMMSGLLKEYKGQIPGPTQALLSVSEFIREYGKYVLAALVVLGLLALWHRQTAAGRKWWDAFFLKIPVIGRIIELSQMARLCSTLSTLLRAGIPLLEALQLTHRVTENTVYRDALAAVYQEVSAGSSLESAIIKPGVFPGLLAQTVGVSEQAGGLVSSLGALANFYDQETEQALSRATDLIEPVVVVVVGGLVGFVGTAVVSSMYAILPQIK